MELSDTRGTLRRFWNSRTLDGTRGTLGHFFRGSDRHEIDLLKL